jgi:uncharacterized membrane protein YfcA
MNTELLIPLIIFCGSLIYGTFGFGDALFAMPFLAAIIGIKTATPLMTLNGTTLAFLLFLKHYKAIDWKAARKLIVASVCGIPIGIYFLKNGNESVAKIILGIIIIGVSVYNLFIRKESKEVKLHPNLIYLFGFIAGILGGAFNTGGPPIAIYGTLSGWSQLQFVSTLQGYFLPNDFFILAGQYASGLLTKKVFYYYLTGLPFLLIALVIGNKLRSKIPVAKFNNYIFILLLIIGIVFLTRSVISLF